MIIDQLLPKSFKIPEITTYNLDITHDTLRPFLVNLPISDKLFGIECFITQNEFDPYFLSEFHKNDLRINKKNHRLILNEYGESSCFFLQSNKSSVFPFNMDYLESLNMSEIRKHIKSDQLIIFQILCLKRHAQLYQDRLTEAYVDYVNGIELPTNNKIIRSLQHRILEFYKRRDGGYKRNLRIEETEQKLTEEMFYTEIRFMVFRGTKASRSNIASTVQEYFSRMNYVNSWVLSEDKDYHGFFKDLQLRRPSTTKLNQILCTSELMNLLLVNEASVKFDAPIVQMEPVITAEQVVEEEEDKNNPFSIFPRGTKKNRENDIHFSERFNRALRKLSLTNQDVVIQKISHGATLKKITFNLPTGLKLTDLTRATQNIMAELALNDISFEQSDIAGCVSIVAPQEEREIIMIRDCVETLHFKEKSSKYDLPLLLGCDTEGEVIVTCLTLIRHLLICGTTGSGKSACLNSLLTVLFALVSPKNLTAYMIDPKKVELNCYADFAHVQDVYTDMDEAEGLLHHLCEQMEKRYEILQKNGCKNIQQYNRKVSEKESLAYQLIVIDELADLILTHKEVEEYVVRLAQMGRAAGFHLIICTQKPIVDVVTSLIKANIYSRICFLCDAGTSYKVALDEVIQFQLLGRGDGVYRLEGIQGLHRFQGALIGRNEEEEAKIIKHLTSYWKDTGKKVTIDLATSKERKWNQDLDRLKKVVLESGETRMNELKKILNIRGERVKELMEELESLGWVKNSKARNKGYELVLSEEERRKYIVKK